MVQLRSVLFLPEGGMPWARVLAGLGGTLLRRELEVGAQAKEDGTELCVQRTPHPQL